VLVGGLATDFCVWATARQLRQAGFEVILNRAACRGIADDSIDEALEAMNDAGIEFIDSCDVLEQAA
jgi:nicotinamidase/pyrazinamidase